MDTTYFGIFTDGQTVEKLTLEELNDIDDVEFKLKCVKNTTWGNPPTFTIINSDGTRNRFKVGDFEVIDIAEELPGSGYGAKDVKIKEVRINNIFTYRCKVGGIKFLNAELYPFLLKLNEVGGDMYQKYQELEELIGRYGDLKD
jgi:hypothetical protein